MKIDGSCHCGYLKYEAEVDPERVGVCHCLDCQSFSGSAFRGFVPALDGRFEILEGEPSRYIKTAASGHENAMLFCARCGTHICSTGAEPGSTFFGIRWGTVRQRGELPPRVQIFCRTAHEWTWDLDSLPKRETQ